MDICFEKNTYQLNETVYETYYTKYDITNETKYWTALKGKWGQCHTFQYDTPLKSDFNGLLFGIDPTASSYVVFLHDPKFYYFALNPLVFPRFWKQFKVFLKLTTNILNSF